MVRTWRGLSFTTGQRVALLTDPTLVNCRALCISRLEDPRPIQVNGEESNRYLRLTRARTVSPLVQKEHGGEILVGSPQMLFC